MKAAAQTGGEGMFRRVGTFAVKTTNAIKQQDFKAKLKRETIKKGMRHRGLPTVRGLTAVLRTSLRRMTAYGRL
jgi:DNA-binding phage protein